MKWYYIAIIVIVTFAIGYATAYVVHKEDTLDVKTPKLDADGQPMLDADGQPILE